MYTVRERERESKTHKTQSKNSVIRYTSYVFSEHFYTSPYGLTEVLTVLQCSLVSPYANFQIYSSRNICPMASWFPHRSDLSYTPVCVPVCVPSLTDRSQPIRPMLILSLNTYNKTNIKYICIRHNIRFLVVNA